MGCEKCSGSCGNCSGCSGCGRELVLTQPEIEILHTLGQVAFLPVARRADSMEPIYLEQGQPERNTPVLQSLESKGLISLDFDKPLQGFDDSAYRAYPLRGSMALTARGQEVLLQLELLGIQPE